MRRLAARDVDLLRVHHLDLRTCYASSRGKITHKAHCTVGHPKCKWRRKEAGQVVCDCPAYGFPHRQGSGLCGQQIYGKWRRAGDPERLYTTLDKSGTRERFATLKRAMEHAQIVARHSRRAVDVYLGARLISRVHGGRMPARDVKAPVERRAETRTIDLFTGKTKLEEGAKGRHDWKAEAQKAARELAECRRTGRDPSSATRRGGRAMFARRVVQALIAKHGFSPAGAVRSIGKWHALMDHAWRRKKSVGTTADHLVKYEAHGMCPCKRSGKRSGEGKGRDCARCATKGRR